jgi:hypothetical protein
MAKQTKTTKQELLDLCVDFWWFIENVNEETPDRTERFFALRERYREVVQSNR